MYEPNAYATESPSYSLKDEQKRKIRIAAGGFQSVLLLKDLLNIFKFGKLSFLYISHRVLRWVVCPVLLPVMYFSNLFIYLQTNSFLYMSLLVLQTAFYLFALMGWLFSLQNIKISIMYVVYYFLFMNVAMYFGFFRFLNKSQSVLWEKAKRKE